ncbi:hypothetical protein [Arthrobacter antioxidans]|uniref:hypothetical protein n=1 Tax=Arthrobacter antioxidans TaxID=2895818 RepID=UPI003AEFFFFE
MREETGLGVDPCTLTLVGRFVKTSALLDLYVARVTSDAELTSQQSEVLAADWVTPEEVDRRLDAGVMADSWNARLNSLRPSTTRALTIAPEGSVTEIASI